MHGRRDRRIPGAGRHRAVVAVVAAMVVAACGGGTVDETSSGGTASVVDTVPTSSTTTAPAGCEDPTATDPTTTTIPSTTTPSTTATTAPTGPTTTTAPSTTTTTAPTTTTVDEVLLDQQRRLTALGYWLGPVDGRAGPLTAHAVTAFQKAEGLPRTGELDDGTVTRLAGASTPTARSDAGTVIEIDLDRQILLVVVDGTVTRIHDIATGSAATPTPPGEFEIDREIDGIRDAPLGRLYRPKYFNGGIALHGYTSVPPQPASHGCVRLTYPAMDDLWASGRAPVGTPVWVY